VSSSWSTDAPPDSANGPASAPADPAAVALSARPRPQPPADVQARLRALLADGDALSLALHDPREGGAVQASYAPARWHDGAFELLVSGLAPHTPALRACPRAGVLLLGDAGGQPYARPRLTLEVQAEWPDGAEAQGLIARLEGHFGNIVPLLAGLPDFSALRLRPVSEWQRPCGRLVLGFGAAFAVRVAATGELEVEPEPLRA